MYYRQACARAFKVVRLKDRRFTLVIVETLLNKDVATIKTDASNMAILFITIVTTTFIMVIAAFCVLLYIISK